MFKMKTVLFFLIVICSSKIDAQYYYKDIVTNVETTLLNQKNKKANVIKLVVKSYDFDDTEIDNFLCEQEIENNGKHTITVTGSPFVGENHLHSYYTNQSQLTRSVDSNPTLIIQNNYDYTNNKLSKITVTSFETGSKDKTVEVHQWLQNDKQQYYKMYVIKGGTDTTIVQLKTDSLTNQINEEIVTYKGKEKDHFYYYYDATNNLTDVVQYNQYKRKLLPLLIFEYDAQQHITKKTIFTQGSNDYQMWYYKYNEKGLKTEEQCYLKGNMFRGKLVYNYKYD